MPFEATADDIDFELLAVYLKALAHPSRLKLLWQLRAPANAANLAVRPHRKDDLPAERSMSRQSAMKHLEQLEQVGVIKRVEGHEGGADRWVTNVPHVFALVEEMRKLTAIPAAAPELEQTVERTQRKGPEWVKGTKLVLLTGPWEGKLWRLEGAGPWTVGRSRARSIALTYDPFVSAEHATLERKGSEFRLAVGEDAKNPSAVNFSKLAPGTSRALRHGDIVGLGRSVLVFHQE